MNVNEPGEDHNGTYGGVKVASSSSDVGPDWQWFWLQNDGKRYWNISSVYKGSAGQRYTLGVDLDDDFEKKSEQGHPVYFPCTPRGEIQETPGQPVCNETLEDIPGRWLSNRTIVSVDTRSEALTLSIDVDGMAQTKVIMVARSDSGIPVIIIAQSKQLI